MQNEMMGYIERVFGRGCFRQETAPLDAVKTSKDVDHEAEVVDSE